MKTSVFGVLTSINSKLTSCPEALPRCCPCYTYLSQALETWHCVGEEAAMCEWEEMLFFHDRGNQRFNWKKSAHGLAFSFSLLVSLTMLKNQLSSVRLSAILLGLVLVTLHTGLQSLPPPDVCLERMDEISEVTGEESREQLRVRTAASTGCHWELKTKMKAEGIHLECLRQN